MFVLTLNINEYQFINICTRVNIYILGGIIDKLGIINNYVPLNKKIYIKMN